MICLLLRVLDEFHFPLILYQSKWTGGTQLLSCPALFKLKSGREELLGKASRKSDIDEIVFNQSHPNGQKIHAWKPKAYSNKTFCQKNKKKYSHFQTITTNNSKHVSDFISNNTDSFMELLPNNTTHFSRHQTILTFSESYWQTILHTLPEFISSNTDIFREFLPN